MDLFLLYDALSAMGRHLRWVALVGVFSGLLVEVALWAHWKFGGRK